MPILIVSLLFLALLILEYVVDSPTARWVLWIAQWPLWAVLAVDYCARLIRAEQRWRFSLDFFNLADLIVVLLPLLELLLTQAFGFLRVLRVMRMLRLVRVFSLTNKVAGDAFKAAFRRRNAKYAIGPAIFFSLVIVVAVWKFESPYSGEGIHSFFDAVWWSITTVTTVGYGDITPETTAGRVAAILLMVVGIAVFGYITALMASWFVGGQQADEKPPDTSREILQRLERIERQLAASRPESESEPEKADDAQAEEPDSSEES